MTHGEKNKSERPFAAMDDTHININVIMYESMPPAIFASQGRHGDVTRAPDLESGYRFGTRMILSVHALRIIFL